MRIAGPKTPLPIKKGAILCAQPTRRAACFQCFPAVARERNAFMKRANGGDAVKSGSCLVSAGGGAMACVRCMRAQRPPQGHKVNGAQWCANVDAGSGPPRPTVTAGEADKVLLARLAAEGARVPKRMPEVGRQGLAVEAEGF